MYIMGPPPWRVNKSFLTSRPVSSIPFLFEIASSSDRQPDITWQIPQLKGVLNGRTVTKHDEENDEAHDLNRDTFLHFDKNTITPWKSFIWAPEASVCQYQPLQEQNCPPDRIPAKANIKFNKALPDLSEMCSFFWPWLRNKATQGDW